MSTWALLMVAFGGQFTGMLLFNAVARWIVTVWEAARTQREDGSRRFSPGMAASISAFSSGPWTLVVVGFFAYYVRDEPWWPWFMGGVVAGIGMLLLITASTLRRVKEIKERNAA